MPAAHTTKTASGSGRAHARAQANREVKRDQVRIGIFCINFFFVFMVFFSGEQITLRGLQTFLLEVRAQHRFDDTQEVTRDKGQIQAE